MDILNFKLLCMLAVAQLRLYVYQPFWSEQNNPSSQSTFVLRHPVTCRLRVMHCFVLFLYLCQLCYLVFFIAVHANYAVKKNLNKNVVFVQSQLKRQPELPGSSRFQSLFTNEQRIYVFINSFIGQFISFQFILCSERTKINSKRRQQRPSQVVYFISFYFFTAHVGRPQRDSSAQQPL